eukprot:6460892-Amphidinium_carterae.2
MQARRQSQEHTPQSDQQTHSGTADENDDVSSTQQYLSDAGNPVAPPPDPAASLPSQDLEAQPQNAQSVPSPVAFGRAIMGRVHAEAQAIMTQLKSAAGAAAPNPTFVQVVDNPQLQQNSKPATKQQRQQSAKSDPYMPARKRGRPSKESKRQEAELLRQAQEDAALNPNTVPEGMHQPDQQAANQCHQPYPPDESQHDDTTNHVKTDVVCSTAGRPGSAMDHCSATQQHGDKQRTDPLLDSADPTIPQQHGSQTLQTLLEEIIEIGDSDNEDSHASTPRPHAEPTSPLLMPDGIEDVEPSL